MSSNGCPPSSSYMHLVFASATSSGLLSVWCLDFLLAAHVPGCPSDMYSCIGFFVLEAERTSWSFPPSIVTIRCLENSVASQVGATPNILDEVEFGDGVSPRFPKSCLLASPH